MIKSFECSQRDAPEGSALGMWDSIHVIAPPELRNPDTVLTNSEKTAAGQNINYPDLLLCFNH